MISLSHVGKRYGEVEALSDVSLIMESGHGLVLLGPNGAGKTTLVKLMTGILRPTEGEVKAPPRRSFGVALQEIGLWPHLTVGENLRFAGQLYGVAPRQIEERGRSLFSDLGLTEWERFRFDQLSQGLKRRLNLACALVHDPGVLVLDEPSVGLDVPARRALWTYLERLIAEEKRTILLSTHDMEEAERLGRRVGILNRGKLLALDTAKNLKQISGRGDEIKFNFSPSEGLSSALFSRLPGFVSGTASNGRAHVFLRDGIGRIAGLVETLRQAGVALKDVQVKPAGLGDVFLTLTGHPLD